MGYCSPLETKVPPKKLPSASKVSSPTSPWYSVKNWPFQSGVLFGRGFGAGAFFAVAALSAEAGGDQPMQSSDSATTVAEKILRLFTEAPSHWSPTDRPSALG